MNGKLKRALKKELSDYKFDTSDYIILDSKVRRESSTGRLVVVKSSAKKSASKDK
ncbi:MAG: hypothetical protein JOZ72_09095 [Alphaproteobacteria bacterium]|nr:hypothetical protein [Alphaproteobacteria bacterium]